jgi:NAD(P)-dependent dehydrogenase (short-subunit alcohol dehydrogenase family)
MTWRRDIDFQRWNDFSIDEWRRVFAVKVDAPVLLTHALRKSFTHNASLVNIAGTDGMTGSFGSIAYSASKAALLNVTKGLASLLDPAGIRVNAIALRWAVADRTARCRPPRRPVAGIA